MKVTVSNKHITLLWHRLIYNSKKFCSGSPQVSMFESQEENLKFENVCTYKLQMDSLTSSAAQTKMLACENSARIQGK